MGLLHAGVLSHSGHADLSARVGPDVVLIATLNRTRDLVPDDLAVVRLDGSVAEGDLGGMSTEVVAMHVEVYRAASRRGDPHAFPAPAGVRPGGPAADQGATGHAGRPAGRPRGACLRPGHRDDGLAAGRARGGSGGRTAHGHPRPVIRAARTLHIWG